MRQIAVIFPGMGYHTDKPLLYFGKKLLLNMGYEIIEIDYGEIPMDRYEAFQKAWPRAKKQLDALYLSSDQDIVFLSKSIGTIIASRYTVEKCLKVKNILCTPLIETFSFGEVSGIAFHGSSDPRADTKAIKTAAKKAHIPLYIYEGGNHSIETKDVLLNIKYLEDIVKKYKAYLET